LATAVEPAVEALAVPVDAFVIGFSLGEVGDPCRGKIKFLTGVNFESEAEGIDKAD
jgi:hypothetical protein